LLEALQPDGNDGFFLSPLREEPTDEEVRKLWRSGSVKDDL
jgi:hypothetical protein